MGNIVLALVVAAVIAGDAADNAYTMVFLLGEV